MQSPPWPNWCRGSSTNGSRPDEIAVLTRVNSLARACSGCPRCRRNLHARRCRHRVHRARRCARFVGLVAPGDHGWCSGAGRCRGGVAQPVSPAEAQRGRMGGRADLASTGFAVSPASQHTTRGRASRGVRRRHRDAAPTGRIRHLDLGDPGQAARLDGHGHNAVDSRHASPGYEQGGTERRSHGRGATRACSSPTPRSSSRGCVLRCAATGTTMVSRWQRCIG